MDQRSQCKEWNSTNMNRKHGWFFCNRSIGKGFFYDSNLDATTGKAHKFDSVKILSKTFVWQKQEHPLITKSIEDTNCKKIFALSITDKGLICLLYEERLKIEGEKTKLKEMR